MSKTLDPTNLSIQSEASIKLTDLLKSKNYLLDDVKLYFALVDSVNNECNRSISKFVMNVVNLTKEIEPRRKLSLKKWSDMGLTPIEPKEEGVQLALSKFEFTCPLTKLYFHEAIVASLFN